MLKKFTILNSLLIIFFPALNFAMNSDENQYCYYGRPNLYDYANAKSFDYFLQVISDEKIEILPDAILKMKTSCGSSIGQFEFYLNQGLKLLIDKSSIEAEQILTKRIYFIENWLKSLYQIYEIIGKAGGMLEGFQPCKFKLLFEVPNENMIKPLLEIVQDNLVEILIDNYKKFGLSEFLKKFNLIPRALQENILINIFNQLCYIHPEYLKTLDLKNALEKNLKCMGKDRELIGLLEFICYQLDFYERPEGMPSIFDDNLI